MLAESLTDETKCAFCKIENCVYAVKSGYHFYLQFLWLIKHVSNNTQLECVGHLEVVIYFMSDELICVPKTMMTINLICEVGPVSLLITLSSELKALQMHTNLSRVLAFLLSQVSLRLTLNFKLCWFYVLHHVWLIFLLFGWWLWLVIGENADMVTHAKFVSSCLKQKISLLD